MVKAKRNKLVKAERNRKDYISGLSDDLLHHILSFLPSTKQAIRTSVLSKRWQHVWTHVHNLIFLRDDFLDGSSENVVACLDKTLSLHSSSKVEKFCIELGRGFDGVLLCPQLNSWLSSAVGREAEDLTLDFVVETYGYSERYILPQVIYLNSCLLKLNITGVHVEPNGGVSWESLRDLSLRLVKMTDELIQNILQGTPFLHSLKLDTCSGFHMLDLSHNTHVKMLVVVECGMHGPLQISGPHLEDLEILGNWYYMELELIMSYIGRVTLDFEMNKAYYPKSYYHKLVKKLLQNVRHVKQLTLGNWCVQVLAKRRVGAKSLSSDRKCLILKIDRFDLDSLSGIEILLRSSRDLEKLVINFGSPHCQYLGDEFTPYCYEFTPYCFSSSNTYTFNCLKFHLKTIEISGFDLSECCNEYGYDFLKFLLAKARVLERMVIRDLIEKPDKMLEAAKELLSFPRASPSAVVLLED